MSSDPLPFILRQGHTHTHTHTNTPYAHMHSTSSIQTIQSTDHIGLSRCGFNIINVKNRKLVHGPTQEFFLWGGGGSAPSGV